jgi:hypothetical protein
MIITPTAPIVRVISDAPVLRLTISVTKPPARSDVILADCALNLADCTLNNDAWLFRFVTNSSMGGFSALLATKAD